MIDVSQWLLRLILAGGLGALVGSERESRGHPAGVRTQALVALGAALLTGVGVEAFSGPAADPTRVASQVVTGIGFIGAGVILKNRGTVRGLTTAATLWLSAALGIAVGAGMIGPALLTAGIALMIIYGLRLLKPVIRRRGAHTVHIEYKQGHGTIGPLLRSLQDLGGDIDDLQVEDGSDGTGDTPMRHVTIRIVTDELDEMDDVLREIRRRPEVRVLTVNGR